MPLTKTQSPVMTAREYPIWLSKAEPPEMFWRDIVNVLSVRCEYLSGNPRYEHLAPRFNLEICENDRDRKFKAFDFPTCDSLTSVTCPISRIVSLVEVVLTCGSILEGPRGVPVKLSLGRDIDVSNIRRENKLRYLTQVA